MGLGGWSAVDGRFCVVSRQLVKVEIVGSKQGEAGRELGSRKASVTSGNSSGMGYPMAGCGKWVTDLRGHCVQAHIPEVFQDLYRTGEEFGRARASALQTILRVLGGSGGICLCTRQGC